MHVEGVFGKVGLDPEFVRTEETRVTRGFLRLLAVAGTNLPIALYPLSRAGEELIGEACRSLST